MKKIWLIVIAVLLVVLVGTYFYISTIDWNLHKDKIAAQFSIVTGKRVVFDGPVDFKIFPSPYLSANDIKIYSDNSSITEPLATINKLVANLSLLPLLNGDFKVNKMSILEPEITFSVDDAGAVNWQSPQVLDQEYQESDIEVVLNSVMIERARVNLQYPKRGIDFQLENLNAELTAESINGPYRIDGSYVKNSNLEGFAVSLGQFSSTFDTMVSLVLNQPAYETVVSFDGSVLFKNDAVNGNLVIESGKPVEFINNNFSNIKLDAAYDYPLVISMQAETNSEKIDLSNFVIKYGKSVAAGNVSIPFATGVRRQVEAAFNMTDFDLEPVSYFIDSFTGKKDAEIDFDLGFDLLGDIKSVKTYYNDEIIRDLVLSFDVLIDGIKINDFSAILPGDAEIKSSGEIFTINSAPAYYFENNVIFADFAKLANWLKHPLPNSGEFAYKKGNMNFTIEGDLKNIKVTPFDMVLDKTVINGELGIVCVGRKNLYVNLNVDSVNFDNYILPLPTVEAQKDLSGRMVYKFSHLAFLNDFEAKGKINLGLGIYEATPFENSVLDFNLKDGVLNIESLKIGGISGAAADLSGNIKGFGAIPSFENLKYSVETNDAVSLFNKFDINIPKLKLKDFKNFSSKGIATGSFERVAVKVISKLGTIDNVIAGEIMLQSGKVYFNGDLELRTPDFVKLVNDLGFNYKPNAFSLGVLALKTKFVGSPDKFKATSLNANIGANNIQGAVVFDGTELRNDILANLVINRFEIDRFFYNPVMIKNEGQSSFKQGALEKAEFLPKPFFSKDKINYDFYTGFDLKGKFKIGELAYKNDVVKNVDFDLDLRNSAAKFDNISGSYNTGAVKGNLELGMGVSSILKGELEIAGKVIKDGDFSGTRYGLKSGILTSKLLFNTSADSVDAMVGNLDGNVSFSVQNPVIKGWDLKAIHSDLAVRDQSEGLANLVYDNLQKGETAFDNLSGDILLSKGIYSFSNMALNSENITANMESSGNLINWDTNTGIAVKYADLTDIPPLQFSFQGLMSVPKLTADVSNITATYEAHWAKIEADKKAKEQARLEALNNRMAEQQQKALEFRELLVTKMFPDLDAKIALADNENNLKRYRAVKDSLDKANEDIEAIFAKALVIGFDENFVDEIAKDNAGIGLVIENASKEIDSIYAKDTRDRIYDDYNTISDIYTIARDQVAHYRERYSQSATRLLTIGGGSIDIDAKVLKFKKEIEEIFFGIDKVNNDIRHEYVIVQNEQDLVKLEEYAKKISGLKNEAAGGSQALGEKIVEIFEYIDGKVSAQEKIFEEKQKEEEIKKKLEENTGKIATGTGSKVIRRDIEDIQKSEDAVDGDIKILDFSKESSSTPSRIVVPAEEKTREEIIESTSGFIKKITGDTIESGGTIHKKQ